MKTGEQIAHLVFAKNNPKKYKELFILTHSNYYFNKEYSNYVNIFVLNTNKLVKTGINRIKVVLVETSRKNKWLAEQMGKDESTISQWCTNTRQPRLESLLMISNVLKVDIRDLLNSTKKND